VERRALVFVKEYGDKFYVEGIDGRYRGCDVGEVELN
jgi:hypothetical protein